MISNILKKRVSIRKYQDRPVEENKIKKVLLAAMQAPSACNQQPWEFYVVTNKSMIRKLAAVSPYSSCAAGAPVVIVPVYKEDVVAPAFTQIDMALSAENMWLEATAQGLGMVFLGIAPIEEAMNAVGEILQLPSGYKAFALFPMGYPDEIKEQEDRFHPERIHFIREDIWE